MKQRVNIVELARHLGLAVSTVSKALNDAPT
jgi:DNA-binding LacI/PurR family transcriptional regulator